MIDILFNIYTYIQLNFIDVCKYYAIGLVIYNVIGISCIQSNNDNTRKEKMDMSYGVLLSSIIYPLSLFIILIAVLYGMIFLRGTSKNA